MSSIKFTILPAPEILKNDVECFRTAEYTGEEGLAIKVSPNGVPGIVFQQNNGRSAIEHIITHSGRKSCAPPLFLYGPGTEPSVMNYKRGSTALNFYDQSHFIRDIKEFSGITPKSLSQKVDDFHHDQAGYSYI